MEARPPPSFPVATEEDQVDEAELQRNLGRHLAESLSIVVLSVSGLFFFFGLLGFAVPAQANPYLVASVDIATSVAFLVLGIVLWRRPVPAHRVNAVLGLLGGLVLA